METAMFVGGSLGLHGSLRGHALLFWGEDGAGYRTNPPGRGDGGALPDSMDELLTFPGVGRKIANLLLGDIYHHPAIVADTHCIRISGRLGLVPAGCKDPTKVERVLIPIIAPEEQSDFCHRIVWFGREVCSARAPKCNECPLADLCPSNRT